MSAICILTANCLSVALGQNAPSHAAPANQDSSILQDFSDRVDSYLKLRKKLQADVPLPKTKDSADRITNQRDRHHVTNHAPCINGDDHLIYAFTTLWLTTAADTL